MICMITITLPAEIRVILKFSAAKPDAMARSAATACFGSLV
jgi:hypothetical protein